MIIKTKHFGEIEISEEDIINFYDGIPGFEGIEKYIIIENPNKDIPFTWLQCVDNPDLAFVIINPFIFKENYEFNLPQSAIEKLHIKSHEDISIYSIVTIPEDISKMSANLAAPIVINYVNKRGKQILLQDSGYSSKHLILDEIRNSAVGNNSTKEQEELTTGEVL